MPAPNGGLCRLSWILVRLLSFPSFLLQDSYPLQRFVPLFLKHFDVFIFCELPER